MHKGSDKEILEIVKNGMNKYDKTLIKLEDTKIKGHGGARLGAGRKKDVVSKKRRKITIVLTNDQWDSIDKEAVIRKKTLSTIIREKLIEYTDQLKEEH